MSYCPECEAVIEEDFEEIGEVFTCPECGIDLEIISLDPLEFDLAPIDEDEEEDDFALDDTDDEDEDWDDEDSYDDEEDEY